ncbi:MAG: hypothetical protein MRERV_18c014 [Mycoplasmataceae bacterium RV_VA103A]|nr:MAG: hypothetical protein MRERV_18c014 [Mycoplasmataceae bacterium RV_VA103A]
MVNNQNEFNSKYPKDWKEKIEIKRGNFQGQLVIEDYSESESLNLRNVKNIDKVVLRNLPQLKECVVWDCNTRDLVIEDCPQLKKLVIYKNLLTNLEFLKDLNNLEELKIDGNAELTKVLEPYESDWKACQKNIQELSKAVRENPQALSELREKYADLKTFLKEVWFSLSGETQKNLMNKLDNEIKSQEKAVISDNIVNRELNTVEIKLGVKKSLGVMKEIKKELEEEKSKNQELEKKLQEQKKSGITEQIEQLKSQISKSQKELNDVVSKYELRKNLGPNLNSLFDHQKEITTLEVKNQHNQSFEEKKERKKEIMDYYPKFSQQLDKVCQLKAKITKLEIKLQTVSDYADYKVRLIKHIKDLQFIQESENSFFKEWNKLSDNQQEKLIAGLKKKDTNTNSKWTNETDAFTWSNRANKVVTFVGGGLSIVNPVVGGGITLVSSAVDSVSSEMENYKTKEQEIFLNFLQEFTKLERGYRDLKKTSEDLLLISNVSTFSERINKEIKNLKQEVDDFFAEYDTDNNKEIDDSEWEIARNQLIQFLRNDRKEGEEWELKKVKEAIMKLEEEVEKNLGIKIRKSENHSQETNKEEIVLPATSAKNPIQKIGSGQIRAGIKDWWEETKIKLCTPIQHWNCWECCGQKQEDKEKRVTREEIHSQGESSLQAQVETPSKRR